MVVVLDAAKLRAESLDLGAQFGDEREELLAGRCVGVAQGNRPRKVVASAMRSTPTASAVSRSVTLSSLWRAQT